MPTPIPTTIKADKTIVTMIGTIIGPLISVHSIQNQLMLLNWNVQGNTFNLERNGFRYCCIDIVDIDCIYFTSKSCRAIECDFDQI
jgi:hypothetical protein